MSVHPLIVRLLLFLITVKQMEIPDTCLVCVLCQERLQNETSTVQLGLKGSAGINNASTKRGDTILTVPGQYVHTECRRNYCNPNIIERDRKKTSHIPTCNLRLLRSGSEQFSFKEKCLFCGQYAKLSGKKRGLDVFPVRTIDFQNNIAKVCSERADRWADEVQGRLESVSDLPAADAVYHQSCSVNFRTKKCIPDAFTPEKQTYSKRSRGRPVHADLTQGFLSVVSYLEENDNEQITIKDLVDKMLEICGDAAFSLTYMKQKLQEHFGSSIIITEIQGKSNVVTLRRTATSILHEFYQRQKSGDSETEKIAIINAAARLIRSHIKSMECNKTMYPSPLELSSIEHNNDYLPESLRLLLRTVFIEKNADVKIASVGQAIIQAARPRVIIAPLQIGLGVQLHHQFASQFLIDTLNKLGFCVSYTEVQKFELCAAVSQGTDIPGFIPGSCIQYVADNVDHNIRTLDGHGTFHGMGVIACVTPATRKHLPIKRMDVTKEDILAAGDIRILYWKKNETKKQLIFEELNELKVVDNTWKLDLLLKLSWPIRPVRPGWSGQMQMLQKGGSPGKSSIVFMPMIDMDPNDMSCIYTTLKFVGDHAAKYWMNPVITFDQPLYWKALIVILNEPENSNLRKVVLRLGGFHTMMSYLGCIGHLMQGSGPSELLETVYASNAVVHMMSGKAIARAIRGHLLVDNALNSMIVSELFGLALPGAENEQSNLSIADNVLAGQEADNESTSENTVSANENDITEIGTIYDDLISGKIGVQSISEIDLLDKIHKHVSEYRV